MFNRKFASRIGLFIPLTYYWIIRQKVNKNVYHILDIGCGKGQFIKMLSSYRRFYSVGVDRFRPYINEAKQNRTHNEYVLCDACFLPFKPKSFDSVLCLQVIEHLPKNDGFKLIEQIEEISTRQVIVTTPVGFIPYLPLDEKWNENPLQMHISGWMPTDFIKIDYEIRGQGLRAVYGERGLAHRFPKPIRWLTQILSYLLEPIVYFSPNRAAYMICVKRFQKE